MHYLLKAGAIYDVMYQTFSDGTGGLTALLHLDHHRFPVSSCPSDTKVYKVIDGRIAYEMWPVDNVRKYRANFRRLHGYWPCTLGEVVAKSESQPDFEFV